MRYELALAALLGVVSWCTAGRAAEPARGALALDYEAALSCPDERAFSDLVERRLRGSDAPASAGSQARLRLSNENGGFVGKLELTRPDGRRYERHVSGVSCTEVANALSFVLALALAAKDPSRLAPPPPPALELEPKPETERALPAPSRDASSWRLAGGAQLGLRTGLGPISTTLEGAFIEARHVGGFTWSTRGSLEHSQTVTRIDRNGVTDFSWTSAGVEGCPYVVRLGARWALAPCLGLHLGAIRAVGRPTPLSGARGRASSVLWVDGFSELRLELELLPALALEVQGELIVPFTRHSFTFERPVTPVYRVPGLAAAGSFALVARIP